MSAAGFARELAEAELVDGRSVDPYARDRGTVYVAETIAYVLTAELGIGFAEAILDAEDAVAAVMAEQRSAA